VLFLLLLTGCVGSGTTLLAAKKLGRQFIGIDASVKYQRIFQRRCKDMLGAERQQQTASDWP